MRRLRPIAAAVAALAVAGACARLPVGGGTERYTLTARFDRAVALYPQSDVRVLGLSAGTVTKVEAQGDSVRVTMKMDPGVPVPAGVHATIVPQSLIGERYVQLFPAWREGTRRIEPDSVIPRARTSVPVEPDEALAALKEFLDTLEPDSTGRLVQNLAADLEGTGPSLNRALEGLAKVTSAVADKDEELARILASFDDLTATLRTREAQLGQVLDSFAEVSAILAEERRAVEGLVRGLGQVSTAGLDLVSEHGAKLDRDLTILTRTLQAVEKNLGSVIQTLDAGPTLASGIRMAVNREYHRVDLRTQFSPAAAAALKTVFDPLGLPVGEVVCLPIEVTCLPEEGGAASTLPVPGVPAPTADPGPAPAAPAPTAPAAPSTTRPPTPIDGILDLVGRPGPGLPAVVLPSRSRAEQVAAGLAKAGGFLRRAAASLVGAVG